MSDSRSILGEPRRETGSAPQGVRAAVPERQSPVTLRQQIAQLGLQPQITIRKSGNWHVRIGNYDLTITNPNEPISAANIVAGAKHFEGRKYG